METSGPLWTGRRSTNVAISFRRDGTADDGGDDPSRLANADWGVGGGPGEEGGGGGGDPPAAPAVCGVAVRGEWDECGE